MAAEKKHTTRDSYANTQIKTDISLVNRLLSNTTNKRDELIIKIFGETGCTSNELINIKYEDINFQENKIIIRAENTRNKTSRTINISENLSKELSQFCNNKKKYVFYSIKSPQLRTRTIRKIFDNYSKKIGEKITTKSIRKAFIIELLNKNKSLEETKKIIGLKQLKNKKYLKKKELIRIRKNIENKRDLIIIDILYETGCKLNELTNIKIKDIKIKEKQVIINSQKQINAFLSKKLSLQIKTYVSENNLLEKEYLFSSRQSSKLSEKRIFQIINKYSEINHQKINSQILRNSYIANSFSAGESVEKISEKTGISNLNKTGIYGSLWSNKNG